MQTEVVHLVWPVDLAQPVEHLLVLEQRPVAGAAGDEDDVGVGHLGEGVVGD